MSSIDVTDADATSPAPAVHSAPGVGCGRVGAGQFPGCDERHGRAHHDGRFERRADPVPAVEDRGDDEHRDGRHGEQPPRPSGQQEPAGDRERGEDPPAHDAGPGRPARSLVADVGLEERVDAVQVDGAQDARRRRPSERHRDGPWRSRTPPRVGGDRARWRRRRCRRSDARTRTRSSNHPCWARRTRHRSTSRAASCRRSSTAAPAARSGRGWGRPRASGRRSRSRRARPRPTIRWPIARDAASPVGRGTITITITREHRDEQDHSLRASVARPHRPPSIDERSHVAVLADEHAVGAQQHGARRTARSRSPTSRGRR